LNAISKEALKYATDDADGALMLTTIKEDETAVQFVDNDLFCR